MRRVFCGLLGLLVLGSTARGDPPPGALLRAHRACDRLVLEGLVGGSHPTAMATLLSRGTRAEKLAVMRGAAGAIDPTALLGPLARAMAAKDPELSPAAAMALLRIAERLKAHPPPELTQAELTGVLSAATGLARDPNARPDLRSAGLRLEELTR